MKRIFVLLCLISVIASCTNSKRGTADDPNKKQWTVKEANKAYSKERVCIGNKPIWKICKMEKEPYNKYT